MNILKFKMNIRFIIISIFNIFMLGFAKDDMNLFVQNTRENLQNNLTKFADELLGLSKLENIYVLNVTENYQQFDVRKNVDNIVQIVSKRFKNAVDVLHENKKYIEEKYRGTNIFNFKTNCCDMKIDKYFSNAYGTKKKVCFSSAGIKNRSKIPKNSSTFFHNQRTKFDSIVLQYFGDLDGHYLQYPAAPRFCTGNKAKDPRFENWYVCTATPYKKNIMLVIDDSGSMVMTIGGINHPDTPTRESLAKEAANTVLNTLSPKDYVGIVTFGKQAKTAPGCLGVKMAQATEENKGLLRNFINSTEAIEPTTLYETAFAKAFQLFNASKKDNPEQFMDSLDMILFLTDGVAHDTQPEILEKIASGQSWMDNKVHIFVYGLGQELLLKTSLDNKMKLLYQIADQNNQIMSMPSGTGNTQLQWPVIPSLTNRNSSVGPVGNITFISDSDGYHLKDIMGKYYTQFPLSQYPQLTISLPHSDKLSGVVVTLGLPTIDDNGNFFGVTAVDVSYEQMFYEVVHFKQKRHSYAFIVGSGGTVLSHPYLSLPTDNVTQPVFYSVQQLEPSLSTDALRNISNGIEGEEAASAVVWTDDRSKKQLRNAVFYIRPVTGFEQNYTIVFVIFNDDLHSIFNKMVNNRTDVEIVTRVHNTTDYSDDEFCSLNDKIIQDTSNSTVMFSRDLSTHLSCQSFGMNQKCLYGSPGGQNDSLYEDNNSTLLQGSLTVDIFVTEAVSQYWSQSIDVQRRYIGTESGIFRINPGIPIIDTLYDPRADFWYNEAVQNSEAFTFRMKSVIGQQDVVSITSTYKTNSTSGTVGGVIGSEIHHHHLDTLLMNVMAVCIKKSTYSCYIVDDKGYVIYQFQRSSVQKHITKLLPRIANYLIKNRHLEMNWCKDLNIGERHLSYKVVTTGQSVQYNGSNVCGDNDFILSQITHTNLYLLVDRNTTYCPPGSVYHRVPVCHCKDECKTCDIKQIACQCPCVCKNNPVAACDRQFNINSGYRPCAESGKGLTLQRLLEKFDQNTHQNVSKCKQPCVTHSNQSDCETDSDCTWCQSGYYKTYPACVHHCIRDRVEIKLFSPCVNITDITPIDQDKLMQELKDGVVSLISSNSNMNFTVTQPQILPNNIVKLFIETPDGIVIPDESLGQLKPAIQFQTNTSSVNVTFLAEEKETSFSDLQITLYVKGINFTDKLQHSLTLRQYVHHVIHNLAKSTFIPGVASTVTDIWLQNNTTSFWITDKAKVNLTEQVKPLLERQKMKALEFDLLGDNVTVEHIESKGSYNKYCLDDCLNILTEDRCNSHHYCHWEETESNCTNNPLLPERMNVTIYFPCLGLYETINDTTIEDDILAEFQQKLQNQSQLISKVAHSFEFRKDTDTVGSYIQFIIQGRLLDPPVTETVWQLKQHMSWSSNFTIAIPDYNGTDFRSDVKQRKYQDFTNLQISLAIKDINLEDFLTQHPFNGRLEIHKAIFKIAMSHFLPEGAKSVNNIRIYKDYVEFMVSKSPDSDVNLRLEYKRLKLSIDKNHTKIILFGKELELQTDYFTGSFQDLCPRICNEVFTEFECRSIGGCQWSQKRQCEDNYLLTEKKEISVVFPCAGLNIITKVDRNKVLSLVEQSIRSLPLNISQQAIHTFTFGKAFVDSIKFEIQGMSKDPPLVTTYRHLTKFIHNGQITLDFGQNWSSIVGIDAENHDSFMMYLEYPVIKRMAPKEERIHIDKVKRQLNDFLMPDIQFINGYLHLYKSNTTLILDAHRENMTVDIEDILDKIRQFISIGGLSIITNTARYLPTNVIYRGIYIDRCPNNCNNSLNGTSCQELSGCHLETVNNITSCTNNPYLSDQIKISLHLPCNSTQSLNITDIQETRDDLLDKITNILSPVSNKIVTDIDIKENDVILTLQATSLFPYIQRYAEKIKHSHLNFGPNSDPNRFTATCPGEFSNAEIALKFNTIDFDGMQNSLLATRTDIIESLQRKLDSILLAETMKYFHVISIKDDLLIFQLQKDRNGLISMAEQVERLGNEVKNDMFVIDLPYIRPVISTSFRVKKTFKSLCPEKYQDTVTILPTLLPVGQANTTGLDYQTTGTFISPSTNMVSVVMVYNSFEVTERKLQSYINVTAHLDICFIPVTQLYTAKKKCKLNICIPSINPPIKPNKDNKSPNVTLEIPGHYDIGPGEAAGITLASLLGLLLAIGAAVLAYNMKKKATMKKMEAKAAREIEDTN